MVTPFNSFAPFTTNFLNINPAIYPVDYNIASNRWLEATLGYQFTNTGYLGPNLSPQTSSGTLVYNLFDVRLRFSWPVLANGKVGPNRQTYRTLVASQLQRSNFAFDNAPLWFFLPQYYATTPPTGL
jgi:hypothetical protein